MNSNKNTIAVIGLGYVGLPLAIEIGKIRTVIGYDINEIRIKELLNSIDTTNEVQSKEFKKSINLSFTNQIDNIKDCEIYIITLPTPVDEDNHPDLSLLERCCNMIGPLIQKGNIVIFESTVYPGVTEEFCAPIIERQSKLKFNKDFFCGYSPERINPGDKSNHITKIVKVTSGSTKKIAVKVDRLYKEFITAGTHMAPSIKVAEAAKVIENTQRDVNIALVNEFSMIFDKLGLDTKDVLEAASTKWNFLPFKPGLVGGHCIGIDPYYLAYKSMELGYKPKMILSGREINNSMGSYIVKRVIALMKNKKIRIKNSKILILGITFKENCPDVRNSKVFDIINEFIDLDCQVDVYDPYIKDNSFSKDKKFSLVDKLKENNYDSMVIAVAHNHFKEFSTKNLKKLLKKKSIIFDVKHILKDNHVDGRL